MSENIEISVSNLHSVLDCPLCFWLTAKGLAPPSFPLPGVLSRMDAVIKGYMKQFIGHSDLPEWFPVKGTFLGATGKMKTTDPMSGVTLKGMLDALVLTPDGKYYIVDYKTASPKEEIPDYYQMQLDGYAFLLEGNGKPVAGGALLYFTPEESDLSERKISFRITPVHAEVDPRRVLRPLMQAKKILKMESPPQPSDDCQWCEWRGEIEKALR
jgi:CRISPR/Cas system-associated exonuclease Cas4 (RecB family)